MLWWNLKRTDHYEMPANLNELKQYCDKQGPKIPLQICKILMNLYRKLLLLLKKGVSTRY